MVGVWAWILGGEDFEEALGGAGHDGLVRIGDVEAVNFESVNRIHRGRR